MGFRVLGVFLAMGILGISFSDSVSAAQFTDFGPYKGKVVDAETKEPIEGAVVHITWWKLRPFGQSSIIDAQETKTDTDGFFEIPGLSVFSPWTRLTTDVYLIIYKSEYKAIDVGAWKKWIYFDKKQLNVWKIEDEIPFFLLKKLPLEKRYLSIPSTNLIPPDKKILLIQEINKERASRNLDPVTD